MTTQELIFKWLDSHQSGNIDGTDPQEFKHFVDILTDAADYCVRGNKDRIIKRTRDWLKGELVTTDNGVDPVHPHDIMSRSYFIADELIDDLTDYLRKE